MLSYSFLMLSSGIIITEEDPSGGRSFPLSAVAERQVTLAAAIHRQVMVWLMEELMLWYVQTDRIKSFRPRRI